MQQLDCLVALHGRERVESWKALAAAHRWAEMVRRLLGRAYDRRTTARFTATSACRSAVHF